MTRWPIAILLMSSMLMAQDQNKVKPETKPKIASASERFGQLTEQFMHQSLALSPVNASQAGYHKHNGRALDAELDDLSLAAAQAQGKFYREWRERFRSEAPKNSLNGQDIADLQLIDDQISLNLLELDQIQNYRHNPTVTLMRTTPEENDRLGKEIAEKASAAKGPTAVLVPRRGVSAIDAEGQPFWWPEADQALFQSLRNWISPRVRMIEVDLHINDPAFAETAAQTLLETITFLATAN